MYKISLKMKYDSLVAKDNNSISISINLMKYLHLNAKCSGHEWASLIDFIEENLFLAYFSKSSKAEKRLY